MTTPGGAGTAATSAPNPTAGGLNSVIPGWQGPVAYSTGQANITDQQAAQLQAAQVQAAQQYASGVLGSFFGSGAGYAPQYSPAYQNAYPQAYAQTYAQIAGQTPPPAQPGGTR